jgi:hypothetical protein
MDENLPAVCETDIALLIERAVMNCQLQLLLSQ